MPSIDPDLFKIYGFWGSVLALKLVGMIPLIARYRFSKKIFVNPDDCDWIKGGKVLYNDPDIERVRRSHLNDLENIPIWYIVTLLWLTTEPSVWLASTLMKTFVLARIAHTLFYAVVLKQPHRLVSFFVGLFITIYQAISTLSYYA
ncbi:Microsomal glutathione S-transferase 1 [Dufourea novaeangliae]|uniref:Microsomal glutathione S-transferase 1 n=1 Tax=Dufourea novaeangliae TaxID=178035 RepID=A0A154NZH6_DUFNO|nr:Microsomal glutathione S-transferase 1 [Dufourea novaeangliae]